MDGRRIGGRYRLLEQRAIGGMATVWRAVDERTGRQVAVKLLHPHLAADRGARRRLRYEAATLASIDHPNVVAVRGAVSDANAPALVMDWVDGRTVAERLAAEGRLPDAEAAAIARDIADGLGAVHAQGIVHRDVKPSNILLDADGRAHLIDLGIAADAETDGLALTAADGVIGTMRYLAPERLAGQAAVPATDVWGLGAVLYEMVAGEVAFPSTNVPERVEADGRLPERPATVSDATWSVIERALASDPADRYPDGGAMATDLRAITGPGDVAAGDPWAVTTVVPISRDLPPPAGDRRPLSTSRDTMHRAWPAILGLGALVLVAAVAWSASGEGALFDRSDTPAAAASGSPASPEPSVREAVTTPAPTAPPEEPDDGGEGDGNGNGRGNGNGGNGNGNGNGNGGGNGNDD